MKNSVRYLFLLICSLASIAANAATWEFEGIVTQCNALACDLAGITVGEPISGFVTADDAASGPDSTFGAADIVDYGFTAQGVTVGPADSTLVSATITLDAQREFNTGMLVFAGQVDGGIFGTIDLDISFDVGADTWMIETDTLGLGVIASGPGQWAFLDRDMDGDGVDFEQDNCLEVANPAQRDTDGDGIGNFCDPDFDQNCIVNFPDLSVMSDNFFVPGDLNTDLDGSGQTNFGDLSVMQPFFFGPPGPSGIANLCTP